MRLVFSIAFEFVALCTCAAGPVQIPGEEVRSKPLPYLGEFLKARVHAPVSQIAFQRDSTGSKLFISFFYRKGNEPAHRTLIVTRDGIKEVPAYHIVEYDDQENLVFRLEGGKQWYEGEGRSTKFLSQFEEANYIFKTGASVPFKAIWAQIKGVSGGDFVLLKFREKPGWIVSTLENPSQPIIEPKGMDSPECAYATADSLIIFGTWRQPEFLTKCLIYRKSSDGYQLSEEIPIPWGSDVYDFNVKTGDALITGKGQFSSYYRFNIKTKRRSRLGFSPSDDVLFLKPDVIKALDEALKDSRKVPGKR